MPTRNLPTVVKRLRKQRKLSQAALGRKVGVTEAYISMIESGARPNPSLPTLQKLARALGVSVAELLE